MVYLLSIPIESFLSNKFEPVSEFRQDLLNDILSVIFYYEVSRHFKFIQPGSTGQTIFKTFTLMSVNGYLTNGFIDYNKVTMGLLVNLGLNHLLTPIFEEIKARYNTDLSNFKGSLETVILLSIANNSLYDTISKSLALLLFQIFLKW
jgi:hypothetical protein